VDAACKLAIVARLGLRAELNAFEIPTQSIASVNPDDFRYARQLGCTIRQISLAELDGDHLRAAVGPALIPLKSPLAACVDNQNAVVISGEQSGDTVLAGRGAGGHPTAVAVVSDLLAIAQAEPSSVNHRFIPTYTPEPMNCRHYVRVTGNKAELICCATSILDKRGLHRETSLECSHRQSAAFVLQSCSSRIAQNAVKQIADMAGEQGSAVCLPLIDSA
jgi:homoserine dehydrogenase